VELVAVVLAADEFCQVRVVREHRGTMVTVERVVLQTTLEPQDKLPTVEAEVEVGVQQVVKALTLVEANNLEQGVKLLH
jgi:hypothetical protein